MRMSQSVSCPRCGTARHTWSEAHDLCPSCLLTTALSLEGEPCPYRVLTPIGESHDAVTYLAQAPFPSRGYVALKMLRPRTDVEAVLSRYQHWKSPLARLRHPSIARLLDVGLTEEGLVYVASEYVAGWSLTSMSPRHREAVLVETAVEAAMERIDRGEIVRQLTDAVHAAHAAGVAHLKLDATKVRLSTANGLHATILGFGSSLIVDGADVRTEQDLAALAQLASDLDIEP